MGVAVVSDAAADVSCAAVTAGTPPLTTTPSARAGEREALLINAPAVPTKAKTIIPRRKLFTVATLLSR
ncbi:MAG: hypothetical protein NVSMB22_07680 [Chloroflexota bacterium]